MIQETWGELANYAGKQGWEAKVHGRRAESEGSDWEREWRIQNDRCKLTASSLFSTLLSSILPLLGTAGCYLIPNSVLLLLQKPPPTHTSTNACTRHAFPQFPPPVILFPLSFSVSLSPTSLSTSVQFQRLWTEWRRDQLDQSLSPVFHTKTRYKSFCCCLALFIPLFPDVPGKTNWSPYLSLLFRTLGQPT